MEGLRIGVEKGRAGRAFLLGLAIAAAFFLPFIAFDQGLFLFYGDFNVQQIPFYQMCHDAVRSGNIFWSWTTDLGANFIGSYSFYLLGSPFFWATIPFPSEAVPYLMGPLLILKFACASLTGYVYLRRYAANADYAVLGGLLYAFSGFSVYNIFFNHFHEAIVFFPLLLFALDEFVMERRRGLFCLMVAACCFVNYYFFVGQVVFCLLYFLVRVCSGNWRIRLRDFGLLALESALGVLLTSGLLLPTVLAVLQNPRVDNPPDGWGALLYGWNQRYVHILECFFFPPDIPARPNFTPDSESKWASLGAWLPLFGMTGAIGFLQIRRKSWLKKLLFLLALCAFIPVLNSAFQLFNSSYYARWFYMLTLMLALATLIALQSAQTDWKRAVKWSLGFTLGIALPIGLMPETEEAAGGTESVTFGLEAYPTRFWAYVAIALLCLLLLAVLLRNVRRDRRRFVRSATACVAAVSVLYAAFFLALGKTQTEDPRRVLIPHSINGGDQISLPEGGFARADFYECSDNQGMFWQMPTIQAFHSIVPGSVMEFYPSIGVTRDVGSRPDTSTYGLRGLTSCRWLFDEVGDNETFGWEGRYDSPKMPGWTYYGTQNGFDIWENEYYIPMGFSYDYYVTEEEYEATPVGERNLLLLKALVLTEEQAAEYGGMLSPLPGVPDYTQEEYFQDCLDRRSMACSSFSYDNTGFTAEYTAQEPGLVFFSVPYESGWSATVNGRPVEVERVSVGFMAVAAPEGESVIRFTYRTPGLVPGLLASGAAALLFAAYLPAVRRWDRIWRNETRRRKYRVVQPLPAPGGLRRKDPPPQKEEPKP